MRFEAHSCGKYYRAIRFPVLWQEILKMLSGLGHVELTWTESGNERRAALLPPGHGILGSTRVKVPRDFHMRP